MPTSDDVRRMAADAQWATQMRKWKQQQQLKDISHHTPRSSSSSSPASSPASSTSSLPLTCVSDMATAASQLSSLRRLSASTASLSRKPADALKPSRAASRQCRYLARDGSSAVAVRSSEEMSSEESEYRLSADSSLSSSGSDGPQSTLHRPRRRIQKPRTQPRAQAVAAQPPSSSSEEEKEEEEENSDAGSSSSSSSSPSRSSSSSESSDPSESPRSRRRRLQRNRQARYMQKKRQHKQEQLRQQSAKAEQPVAAVATCKRRLSSNSHVSPTLLPAAKAQMVDEPVKAITLRTITPRTKLLSAKLVSQPTQSVQPVPFMSPLTLGIPAASVATVGAAVSFATSSSSSFVGGDASAVPFLNVSADVFYIVLSFLHSIDLLQLCAVSSAAHTSTSDPSIWRPLVDQAWPISCAHSHDWKRVYCTRIKRALAGAQYFCTFCACTRTFKLDGLLVAHVANHSQQHTAYSCSVSGCGLSFDTARKLHYHVKRHGGTASSSTGLVLPAKHACTWPGCTLAFPTPYALALHHHRHTHTARPHPCRHPHCTASFNSRSALATHTQTHVPADERVMRWACGVEGCDRVFMSASGVRKHRAKAHSGGGGGVGGVSGAGGGVRFVCEVGGCGRGFYFASELRKHVSKRHKQAAEAQDELAGGERVKQEVREETLKEEAKGESRMEAASKKKVGSVKR